MIITCRGLSTGQQSQEWPSRAEAGCKLSWRLWLREHLATRWSSSTGSRSLCSSSRKTPGVLSNTHSIPSRHNLFKVKKQWKTLQLQLLATHEARRKLLYKNQSQLLTLRTQKFKTLSQKLRNTPCKAMVLKGPIVFLLSSNKREQLYHFSL